MLENTPEITPLNTVLEAQQYVRKHLKTGVKCPVCEQRAQIYKRPLTAAMTLVLHAIYLCHQNELKDGYLHVENYLKKIDCPASMRGDFPKLRFWELIEAKPEDREDGSNRNGYYRITTKGENFVEALICVPDHVFIYNNQVEGVSNKMITFEEALKGQKFDFKKITTQK